MPRLARYAWFVLGFNVVVVVLGALVRATGSGAGCGPSWPTCQGEITPELAGATAIEYTHRLASGLALVLVALLAFMVWRSVPRGEPSRLGAGLSLVAIVGEALIGAVIVLAEWVADDTSVARAIAVPFHLVNTLFLLASLALTGFWLSGGRRLDMRARPSVTRWVLAGGICLVLIAASGAVTALADTLFPKEAVEAGYVTGEHFLTDLRIIHPILAVVSALAAWLLSGRSLRREAKWVAGLVGAMLLTGALNVALDTPIWLQLLHLALADALWVAFVLASARALQAEASAVVPTT